MQECRNAEMNEALQLEESVFVLLSAAVVLFFKLPIKSSRAQPYRYLMQHKITHAIYARQDMHAQASNLQKASSQPTSTEIREPHLAWNFITLNT